MATDRMTLFDVAKATDPNGKPAVVAEVLETVLPALEDGPAMPSNAQLAERSTIRAALPVVAYAQLNRGSALSKGAYKQTVDTMAFIDALSEVDVRLQKVLGQEAVNAHRMKEDRGFMQAMGQKVSNTLVYGNELLSPLEFTGWDDRLRTLNTASSSAIVLSMGSGSAYTSIYVMDWGEDGVHFIHPRDGDGVAGIQVRDLGESLVADPNGARFPVLTTNYLWFTGFTVKNPQHMARLANIDSADMLVAAPTQGNLLDKLDELLTYMEPPRGLNRVMYCHKLTYLALRRQALAKTNLALTLEQYLGRPEPHYAGYPIRRFDAVTIAEDVVS